VWAYNNSAIQTLDAILEVATGVHPSDFAEAALLDPIGMEDSHLRRDRSGNALTFIGLASTCLDMARFGHLFLQGGTWDGEQVVPAAWVEEATSPSSDLTDSYGYLWWLNRRGSLVSPAIATTAQTERAETDGQMLPGAPEDVYWALGLGEQVVAVVPSEGIVAVRLGERPPADRPFSYRELTAGVLEAAGAG
jgi:CubicO group peptidase (beta-lactamase class C family)